MAEERLPIKIVQARNEDYQRPESGFGQRKVFDEESLPALRQRLSEEVAKVEAAFAPVFRNMPNMPAVARVRLKEDAIAKSHRPATLLATTPVIGVEHFGELLISVRPSGLRSLVDRIKHDETKTRRADISTIETILPYRESDALRDGLDVLKAEATREHVLKLRLFDHRNTALNAIVYKGLVERVMSLGLPPPEELPYGGDIRIFKVKGVTPEAVEPLARFVGTQSLSVFPRYHSIETASIAVRNLAPNDFPPPTDDVVYPVVGIIDSGTNPEDPFLHPWIVGREEYVPELNRSYDHGSFVAGLIAHSRRLNQGDTRFPETSAKIVDVVALPGKGGLREDDLLSILEEVLPKYPEVRVWNLSLGGDECCDDRSFSDLAMKLDELQDRYGVLFVLAAGNYTQVPLRGWPPDDLGEADRICSPADSLRGITVGSIAHLHRPTYRVKPDEPSPFSRRGPGPVFIPKPELVHHGGNCDDTGQHAQTGVMSIDAGGQLAENIGTSFAAPLVTTLLANVDHALAPGASRNLVKGLVIHSAMLASEKLTGDEIRYRGFGKPGNDPVSVLTCTPWSATLVFEPDLVAGVDFVRHPFPIPPSLRTTTGKVRGGIVMTLVYDPPLNGSFGAEYCRTNVEASLGTYDLGTDGKRHHSREVPPEPKDMAKLYERQLIEHGFKWSPVKVYRRIIAKGIKGDQWRLNVSLTQRSGFAASEPQSAAILVTLFDPSKKAPIYNEVTSLMMQLGWATTNLEVQARLRT